MKRLFMHPILKFSVAASVALLLFCSVTAGNAQDAEAMYRAELMQMIIDKWQDTSEATGTERWRQGIGIWLERLGTDELTAALDLSGYDELQSMLVAAGAAAAPAESLDPALALGKFYYPLDPCRIVDTRIAGGIFSGPVSSGTVASYFARDSVPPADDSIAVQGGMAGGCGVPANADAIVMNIAATGQEGRGHLRAYPWGIAMPLAAILNFSGDTIANATILPICTTSCTYDFSIYASRTTHVVIDVMGYFAD